MYNATKEQYAAFDRQHDYLGSKLKLGQEILWLTKEQCIQCGPGIDEILDIVKDTMIAHGKTEYEMPAKIGIHPYEDVFFHAMPAYVPGDKACGIKWIECYPRNPLEYGLPQTFGLLVLNEILTGYPMAIMDSTWITAKRTPAVTAVTAAALHPHAESFGMFGCGIQGTEHVRFVARALPNLKHIYIYDVREESMDALIAAVKDEVNVPIIKGKSFEEVAKSCEVLGSATKIVRENLACVKREWVGPGQTILPCDLNTFFEDTILLDADKYIVDSITEHELFEEMGYFEKGLPHIYCETGEIIAGLKPGRKCKEELIACSNIGMSVFDVAMGKFIFDRALERNVGQLVEL